MSVAITERFNTVPLWDAVLSDGTIIRNVVADLTISGDKVKLDLNGLAIIPGDSTPANHSYITYENTPIPVPTLPHDRQPASRAAISSKVDSSHSRTGVISLLDDDNIFIRVDHDPQANVTLLPAGQIKSLGQLIFADLVWSTVRPDGQHVNDMRLHHQDDILFVDGIGLAVNGINSSDLFKTHADGYVFGLPATVTACFDGTIAIELFIEVTSKDFYGDEHKSSYPIARFVLTPHTPEH